MTTGSQLTAKYLTKCNVPSFKLICWLCVSMVHPTLTLFLLPLQLAPPRSVWCCLSSIMLCYSLRLVLSCMWKWLPCCIHVNRASDEAPASPRNFSSEIALKQREWRDKFIGTDNGKTVRIRITLNEFFHILQCRTRMRNTIFFGARIRNLKFGGALWKKHGW